MAKALMVVGTSSNVGKSVMVAALCRIFAQAGIRTAPFKSQNMSLNAAVTPSGKEIGRAQAVQALAAGLSPNEHMNPVLLKPTGNQQSQVILQGVPAGNMAARHYYTDQKQALWTAIQESYAVLAAQFDLIVIEGAGSPVEMNLKPFDLANMKVAELADAHVVLVADIERGGVFAAVVGTLELLEPSERARVKGIIINRFQGDLQLFADGKRWLEDYTGIPVLGVVPYMGNLDIAEEDSLALARDRYQNRTEAGEAATVRIGVVQYPHISNFTDFDPLWLEPGIEVCWIKNPAHLAGLDAVILPGSKSTLQDLAWLKEQQFEAALGEHTARGGFLFGICGGYQMMGECLHDPHRIESPLSSLAGLGIFPLVTTITKAKRTNWTSTGLTGRYKGITVIGYEMHMGETTSSISRTLRVDSLVSDDGKRFGTYLHHIFHNDAFRLMWLNDIRKAKGLPPAAGTLTFLNYENQQIDRLANTVKAHLNMSLLHEWLDFAREPGDVP